MLLPAECVKVKSEGMEQRWTARTATDLVEEEDDPGARHGGGPWNGGVEGRDERVGGAEAVGVDEVLESAEVGVGDGAVLVGLLVLEHDGHSSDA